LRRQDAVNSHGEDETIYLKPLKQLLDQGKCPADILIEKWQGEWHQDINKLVSYTAYRMP